VTQIADNYDQLDDTVRAAAEELVATASSLSHQEQVAHAMLAFIITDGLFNPDNGNLNTCDASGIGSQVSTFFPDSPSTVFLMIPDKDIVTLPYLNHVQRHLVETSFKNILLARESVYESILSNDPLVLELRYAINLCLSHIYGDNKVKSHCLNQKSSIR